ncbi:MAG: hypothetical protein A2033_03975 [Bacteroidetes bacterium GWA2_31_9]|nr:MAG: hypothetical protein A2033_03975 [Bacteroidetes bacterium GWA2_31_9]
MDNNIGKWLIDILNCINEIDSFFEGNEKKYDEYCKNILLKRGIERNLEIIGEAVNRILNKKPDIEIVNARQIVQFRNLVIHSYDNISDSNVWAVIINHLPKLKIEVQKLIDINFPNFPNFI